MPKTKENPYIICCEPRVVLFGYATATEIKKEHPTLKRVRMLVYWDKASGGIHGCAGKGPGPGCRVTPAAPAQSVDTKVEARILCSKEAAERFEAQPWA